MLHKRPIIGVMGSHQEDWEEYADPVGDLLARKGYHLLTGAGSGVMTVVARSFTHVDDRKGVTIGILPAVDYKGQNLDKEEYPNPYIEVPMITPLSAQAQRDAMPYSRNLTNVMTAHALIILPGSHGTKNEVSLGLIYNKPLILFGPEDAFAQFPEEPNRANKISQIDEFLTELFEQ
jgi:uncharacterized protein (TIGR00725 family)